MSGKSVATEADVNTQAGETPFTGAESGTWTAGKVSVVTCPKVTINGKPAISSASCTFSFSGQSSANTPVTGKEAVTLSASALGTTKLQGQRQPVLRDGDQSNTSSYGNVIKISSSQKLTSG